MLVVAGEGPDDEGLVSAGGKEHVRVLEAGRQGCDPSAVALEGAAHHQLLRHVGWWWRALAVRRFVCVTT